jgi:hypothetical protein
MDQLRRLGGHADDHRQGDQGRRQGAVRIDETKTAAGRRTLPLPSFAVAVLSARRSLPYLGQQTMVFPSTAGTWRDPDNFRARWRAVRDDLGFPDATSHSFHKTVATLIDDEGLSARIGATNKRQLIMIVGKKIASDVPPADVPPAVCPAVCPRQCAPGRIRNCLAGKIVTSRNHH